MQIIIEILHKIFFGSLCPIKDAELSFLSFVSVAESLWKVVEKLLQALGSMDATR